MEFSQWEAEYLRILNELHLSREKDERSATVLSELLRGRDCRSEPLLHRVRDRPVLVVGAGPGSIPLDMVREKGTVVVAADGATTTCLEAGVLPDVIVTDLDGYVPHEIEANQRGSFALVHAHGDNMPALKKWVPRFTGRLCGSTAGAPREGLVNFGGFTDGDRAVFLAEEGGATSVTLACFDLGHVRAGEGEVKLQKLRIAFRLIDEVVDRGRLKVAIHTGAVIQEWPGEGSRPPKLPAPHSRTATRR